MACQEITFKNLYAESLLVMYLFFAKSQAFALQRVLIIGSTSMSYNAMDAENEVGSEI